MYCSRVWDEVVADQITSISAVEEASLRSVYYVR